MPARSFDLHLRTSLSFVNARDVGRLTAPDQHLMVNGALPLLRSTVDALLDYSSSLPTGTGEGKVWKRRGPGGWWLGRYGTPYPADHQHAGSVPIGWWPIYVEGQPAAFPRDVRVPPAPMRGRQIVHVPPPPELPEGLFERDGKIVFVCLGCDRHVELHCDLDEFDPDMAYGGCSPRCLP